MFTSKIHQMGGGKGIEYASHVVLQCEKVFVKADDNEFLTGRETSGGDIGFYKGNRLKCFTTKNRVSKPMYTAQLYVDFETGMSKYDGLIEEAVKMGFLQDVRGGYVCPSYSDNPVPKPTGPIVHRNHHLAQLADSSVIIPQFFHDEPPQSLRKMLIFSLSPWRGSALNA